MPVPDGSRVQRGGWRPIASACSIQGGNTTGVTHEAAKRWVPERSKTRIRRTGCGVEQFPCRRRARQHPISCAGWGSSPTQQWEEFPESPRAALAPVRRGDGGTQLTRRLREQSQAPVRNGYPVESCSEASGSLPAHCRPRRGDRGGAGRCVRRICGAGAPHRHAATGLRRDAGLGDPVHRRKPIRFGWLAYAGSGTPGRRPAGVTAARPPCGGRSGFESRGGRWLSVIMVGWLSRCSFCLPMNVGTCTVDQSTQTQEPISRNHS